MNIKEKTLKYYEGDEVATTVFFNKYSKDKKETPQGVHDRLAEAFYEVDKKYQEKETTGKKFLSEYGRKRKDLSKNAIFTLFNNQTIIPQGSVQAVVGTDIIGSASNCYVAPAPKDSYGSIFKTDEILAQLMKRRAGVGTDISYLRPNGATVNNAAKSSSGATSFMERFSNTTREVSQQGRRGALMLTMNINHPDILEFIKIKRDLTKVTGANISVKLTKEFLEAVKKDEDFILRFPNDGLKLPKETIKMLPYNETIKSNHGYTKKIRAKELWKELIKSAHNVAEPGVMYWDRMIDYSPDGVYEKYKPISTNPCGEIALPAYDSCRLIAINFTKFVEKPFTKDAYFNFNKFYEIAYETLRLGDDLVDIELKQVQAIINKIKSDPEPQEDRSVELKLWENVYKIGKEGRRTGIGLTGLADMLAMLGIKYDSAESEKIIETVMSIKMKAELDSTIDLAILRGHFEGWDFDKEYETEKDVDNDREFYWGENSWYTFIQNEYKSQFKRMKYYGRRNISFSTVAPTGTISMLAGVSSGIEPLFSPFYFRRIKVVGEEKVDVVDDNGDKWREVPVLHRQFRKWVMFQIDNAFSKEEKINMIENMNENTLNDWYKISPYYKSIANDINPLKRNTIQSIIQKYTTHSISSTINLPSDVSEETVSKIYLDGYNKGLKGQTVYRDGSRSGVLLSQKTDKIGTKFEYTDAVKRPKILEAEAQTIQVAGKKYAVFIGFMDNKPYEVFVYQGTTKSGKGKIQKNSSGNYVFIGEDSKKQRILTDKMDTSQRISTRLVSRSLRHGSHFKFIIEDINKEKAGIFDWYTAIKKALVKHLKDEDVTDKTCPSCGSDSIVYEEGCKVCKSCGWSACG